MHHTFSQYNSLPSHHRQQHFIGLEHEVYSVVGTECIGVFARSKLFYFFSFAVRSSPILPTSSHEPSVRRCPILAHAWNHFPHLLRHDSSTDLSVYGFFVLLLPFSSIKPKNKETVYKIHQPHCIIRDFSIPPCCLVTREV